jgi:hypothetical protein
LTIFLNVHLAPHESIINVTSTVIFASVLIDAL